MSAKPPRVMFLYWGRRGGSSQLALEVGRTAISDRRYAATISVSRQNECFASYKELGNAVFAVDTFQSSVGALTQMWRIPLLRRRLFDRLQRDQTQAVIELMPHVWSPFIAPIIKRIGAKYCTIVHDAQAHLGDPTGWANDVLLRTAKSANLVLTLSDAVAEKLVARSKVERRRIVTVFHPDFTYHGTQPRARTPGPGEPWRLLFLGRIMQYKGLPLFLDTVDVLRHSGLAVDVGVYGEGPLGSNYARLRKLGAEVVNRWLSEEEIASALSRYHAVVLSHTEASQSGVAAAAFGAGVPVVATPVGGLVAQVENGVTGTLAERVDASSLAEAVRRLLTDSVAYDRICLRLTQGRDQRSIKTFVETCITLALGSNT